MRPARLLIFAMFISCSLDAGTPHHSETSDALWVQDTKSLTDELLDMAKTGKSHSWDYSKVESLSKEQASPLMQELMVLALGEDVDKGLRAVKLLAWLRHQMPYGVHKAALDVDDSRIKFIDESSKLFFDRKLSAFRRSIALRALASINRFPRNELQTLVLKEILENPSAVSLGYFAAVDAFSEAANYLLPPAACPAVMERSEQFLRNLDFVEAQILLAVALKNCGYAAAHKPTVIRLGKEFTKTAFTEEQKDLLTWGIKSVNCGQKGEAIEFVTELVLEDEVPKRLQSDFAKVTSDEIYFNRSDFEAVTSAAYEKFADTISSRLESGELSDIAFLLQMFVLYYDAQTDSIRAKFDESLESFIAKTARPDPVELLCSLLDYPQDLSRVRVASSAVALTALASGDLCEKTDTIGTAFLGYVMNGDGRRQNGQPPPSQDEVFAWHLADALAPRTGGSSIYGAIPNQTVRSTSKLYGAAYYALLLEFIEEENLFKEEPQDLQIAIDDVQSVLQSSLGAYREIASGDKGSLMNSFAFGFTSLASRDIPSTAQEALFSLADNVNGGGSVYSPALIYGRRGRASSARDVVIALAAVKHGYANQKVIGKALRRFRRHLPWLLIHAHFGGAHWGTASLASYYVYPAWGVAAAAVTDRSYNIGFTEEERQQHLDDYVRAMKWASTEKGVLQSQILQLNQDFANVLAGLALLPAVKTPSPRNGLSPKIPDRTPER